MSDNDKKSCSGGSYVWVAFYSGASSVAIVFFSFVILHQISDAGMWAIAAMTAAPAVMGMGVCYFMGKRG